MKSQIVKNAVILGFSGFCAKGFDFFFRAYYSRFLGQEGMGILSLGFGIHGVMLTVSTAGLGVAISKLVSGYLEKKNYGAVLEGMKIALRSVFILSSIIMVVTFLGAEWMGEYILGEPRISTGLCCLAPSILFMGTSYCLKGYFYARRRVAIPALSEFLEQTVKGCLISLFLTLFLQKGIEYGCSAVFLGITLGEFSSCCYLMVNFLIDKKFMNQESTKKRIGNELFKIAFPTMLSSLSGSLLRMQEEVWIIGALKRFGMSHSQAVSNLGVLHGMVMPMLIFPLTLIGSVSTLLVPEISRADTSTDRRRLVRMTKKIYTFGIISGFLVMILFYLFPEGITQAIYHDSTIVPMVKTLSLLCPFMFLDSLSCSVLNGMGKQVSLLFYSVSDSLLRLVGILFFVSEFGMNAMIGIICFSNLFTCFLTVKAVLFHTGTISFQRYQKRHQKI